MTDWVMKMDRIIINRAQQAEATVQLSSGSIAHPFHNIWNKTTTHHRRYIRPGRPQPPPMYICTYVHINTCIINIYVYIRHVDASLNIDWSRLCCGSGAAHLSRVNIIDLCSSLQRMRCHGKGMATVRIDDIRDSVLHSKGIWHGAVVLLQHDEHTSE